MRFALGARLNERNAMAKWKRLTPKQIERLRREGREAGEMMRKKARAMQLTARDWRTVVK